MTIRRMPAAEIELGVPLVRALLADQHTDLADRPLVEVAFGWDNAMYRLGDDLAVRMPRRQAAAVLVEHEQRVLPMLAPRLSLPIPAPVRIGRPALSYPWSWSVVPWFDGQPAAVSPPIGTTNAAQRLGRFLAQLHQPAPHGAPLNPVRGHFIGRSADLVAERLDVLGDEPGLLASVADGTPTPGGNGDDDRPSGWIAAARRRWNDLIATPAHAGPPVWLHGDLHTANLLVHEGQISAVIDFGDVCAGDPATDLAIAWMLFDADDRDVFRRAAGDAHASEVDDATWRRAEAWALHFAIVYLLHSADNPTMAKIGRDLIARLLG